MIAITKFFHVMLGVALFGVIISFYFYIINTIRHNRVVSLQYTIQFSLYADIVLFFIFVTMFITGTLLVNQNHFLFSTPWIRSAYILLGLTLMAWIGSSLIRFINYKAIQANHTITFRYKKLYHGLHWIMVIFIIFIIHDAVTKTTFL